MFLMFFSKVGARGIVYFRFSFSDYAILWFQLAAFRVDGSPLRNNDSRHIYFRKIVMGASISMESSDQELYVLPDSGILTFTFTPPVTADSIKVQVQPATTLILIF